ncbi:MAG: hypothetical protein ABI681_14260 [Gemmatimonadales bacterium]
MRVSRLVLAAWMSIVPAAGALKLSAQQQQPRPPAGAQGNPRRELLEQRLRERTGDLVKRRLQLTDAQMTRLQAANRQFEQKQTELLMREREARRELRQQMLSGDAANQNRVAQLIDQTFQLERQRLDLVQAQQRELATFLTPVQRAKLLGLQTELRRRTQELRNRPMQRGQRAPLRGPMRPDR